MTRIHDLPDSARVPLLGGLQRLRPDLFRLRVPMVNAYFFGEPGGPWVLIDAGMPATAPLFFRAAETLYGDRPPEAIVLTHGHLDHIGALHALLARWPVPVYAHPLEFPQLTGERPYPFPDPSVGGGLVSLISPVLVPGPFDFRPHLRPLPEGGHLPDLPGWTWRHTPGHAAGQVSLWRGADRTLISADAFVTTPQESLRGSLGNRPTLVRRPPAYYTPDWDEARQSVRDLAALHPDLAASGHGHPMQGAELDRQLQRLAQDFDQIGRPRHGYYLTHPVPAGAAAQPTQPRRPVNWGLLAAVGGLWLLLALARRRTGDPQKAVARLRQQARGG